MDKVIALNVVRMEGSLELWGIFIGEVKEPIGFIVEHAGRLFLNPASENSLWGVELLLPLTNIITTLQEELNCKLGHFNQFEKDKEKLGKIH